MPSKDFRFGISSNLQGVDLNQLLITHPISSFFFKVASDINELNLLAGDVLLVDRSLKPKKNDLVVVTEPGVEQLKIARLQDVSELELWGVVVHLIREIKP